jgi:hypothetical protein
LKLRGEGNASPTLKNRGWGTCGLLLVMEQFY